MRLFLMQHLHDGNEPRTHCERRSFFGAHTAVHARVSPFLVPALGTPADPIFPFAGSFRCRSTSSQRPSVSAQCLLASGQPLSNHEHGSTTKLSRSPSDSTSRLKGIQLDLIHGESLKSLHALGFHQLLADPGRLGQVLINLLSNAIRTPLPSRAFLLAVDSDKLPSLFDRFHSTIRRSQNHLDHRGAQKPPRRRHLPPTSSNRTCSVALHDAGGGGGSLHLWLGCGTFKPSPLSPPVLHFSD